MSADPVTFTQAESWKLSLPCTKAEAEAIAGDLPILAAIEPPPVLMTSEADDARPDEWLLEAYFEAEPDARTIALIRGLVPSASGVAPQIEKLAPEDWVTLSQVGLEPIHAGRFFIHTPLHRDSAPAGAIAFEIEAGRAFGTGHHETTTGCLLMIDRMRGNGLRFTDIVDVGTGTGLLAFAAHAVWPLARVAASDVDPVAIEVTLANAAANHVPTGRVPGRIEAIAAPGLDHPRLRARSPYDLIIANILAGPLIELAPSIATALLPGGSLILAGLLSSQADAVAVAYRRQGLRLADTIVRGDWPTLRMVKRRR